MKTKLITKLKKELLVIELPKSENRISIQTSNELLNLEMQGYTLLGSPDEISEDDVVDLVGEGFNISTNKKVFNDYNDDCNCFKTALQSFHSALESEIYFNGNPFENPDMKKGRYIDRFGDVYLGKYEEDFKKWKEAQEKTFDKNKTLIFVKN